METQKIKTALQSKQYKKAIGVFLIAVIALLLFNLGMRIGYVKASFANQAGDNYYQSGMPRHALRFVHDPSFGAHGANGRIVSIDLPTIIVADNDSTEKVVRIEDETIIRKLRDTIGVKDLAVGDVIVVIGEPNASAEVDARLIRVIPEMPTVQR